MPNSQNTSTARPTRAIAATACLSLTISTNLKRLKQIISATPSGIADARQALEISSADEVTNASSLA
ncbi:hypothetical protein D3C85_1620660 [compost metagenome]